MLTIAYMSYQMIPLYLIGCSVKFHAIPYEYEYQLSCLKDYERMKGKSKLRPQAKCFCYETESEERAFHSQNMETVCDKQVPWLLHHLRLQSHQNIHVLQDWSFLLYIWKKISKKSPGVYKKKPSKNGTGTVDTGHSHEDSSLPLLTKSMS